MTNDLRLGFEAWRVILKVLRDSQADPEARARVEQFIAEHEAITDRIGLQSRAEIVEYMVDLGDQVNAFIAARDASAQVSAQASADQPAEVNQ